MANETFCEVEDISKYDTKGFFSGFKLLRSKFEWLANQAVYEFRLDWQHYVGDLASDYYGSCNPINGNIFSLAHPLCRPERVKIATYVVELGFFQDDVMEHTAKGHPQSQPYADDFSMGEAEKVLGLRSGVKQLLAKLFLELETIDPICSAPVIDKWKEWMTSQRELRPTFESFDNYLDFRVMDAANAFIAALLLFGLGFTLTDEEHEMLAPIIHPCYAALALTNDYFSFNKECDESQKSKDYEFTNATKVLMDLEGLDADAAKDLVKQKANSYAVRLCLYLDALSFEMMGNLIWNLNCPRYHPENRYNDPNAGLENVMTAELRGIAPSEGSPWHNKLLHSVWKHNEGTHESPWSSPKASSLCRYLKAPFEYISSCPGKGVRREFIDALNLWAKLPNDAILGVQGVIDQLHIASLMIDDIQDGSKLRRGSPSAHEVFGIPQTINATSFAIIDAIEKARRLSIPHAADITTKQLHDIFIGQSYDLYWTRHSITPSESEYVQMVRKKTGGPFQLITELMCHNLSEGLRGMLHEFVNVLAVFFQIRDDYQNLTSTEYTMKKGELEDLDEGKFSFILVHHFNSKPDRSIVYELLRQRHLQGGLSKASKLLIMDELKRSKSIEYTLDTLKKLEEQCENLLGKIEDITQERNWVLRYLLHRLRLSSLEA
ncbi:geranylgeranyl pyrophosphate synthase [Fusarium sporotrichioides]|uniref:Geranylgeranyl pyrophosphate synthase n=1 Tax=Fusarium sporotrichioides TaxID=5514 RepID=A0A395RSP7_FUSSP|nr:geranylgeranyl pyrophosphate synthase [Fusarium sporotrichioides]